MSTVVRNIRHAGLRLASSQQNAVTVTGSGTVATGQAVALYGGRGVASWNITNLGRLSAGRYGIQTGKGAYVANGGTADPGASIYGDLAGILVGTGAARIVNDGSILGGTSGASYGIEAGLGGTVVNGVGAHAALIRGARGGVLVSVLPGSVVNDATIAATAAVGIGVLLARGGSVTNGTGNPAAAILGGAEGVSICGTGNVVNDGTIRASHGIGVYRTGSGSVVNGSNTARHALIAGAVEGVRLKGAGARPLDLVVNLGVITGGTTGVEIDLGGTVVNGSAQRTGCRIAGTAYGVSINAAGTITNFGTISGNRPVKPGTIFPHPMPIPPHTAFGGYGVDLQQGGALTNGSNADTLATISGAFIGAKLHGANSYVRNYGTIQGGVVGIYNYFAGSIANGSSADFAALIEGGQLGFRNTMPQQTLVNYGTIASSAGSAVNLAAGGQAACAGTFVNGSATDTRALAAGWLDGLTSVSGAIVRNYATIIGTHLVGAYVTAGGMLTNGSAHDTAAMIRGDTIGAAIKGEFVQHGRAEVNSLINDGTILGAVVGAAMLNGGVLVNGGPGLTHAVIKGGTGAGVENSSQDATILNDGTIASARAVGVSLVAASRVVNGGQGATQARIGGSYGVVVNGGFAHVANYGTIVGWAEDGVLLSAGGALRNGSASDTAAVILAKSIGVAMEGAGPSARLLTNFGTISGAVGVVFEGPASATVVNAGTIIGTDGIALQFGAGADRLVLDPGAAFQGQVQGGPVGTNTLELAPGAAMGHLGGLGQASGNGIEDFAEVTVDTTARWSLSGVNRVANLDDAGLLQVAAGGHLHVTAAVDPASSGVFQIEDDATLEIAAMHGAGARIAFAGTEAARLVIDAAFGFGARVGSLAYAGPLLQDFGPSDAIDLTHVSATGAALSFSAVTGLLQVAQGGEARASLRFDLASLGAGSFHAAADGTGGLLLTHA